MAGSSCIIADGVSKRFGSVQVLEGLSLSIAAGTVFGLVGLNGAGKTTLIRLLLGLLKADSGTISILGKDPWGHEPGLYRRLGVVLEHEGFWGNLTVEQNIRLFGEARGMTAQQRASYLAQAWSGTDLAAAHRKVRFLSRGQKVQCGLCRAFMGWPEVLLLDEPTVALDVKAYDHFCALVRGACSRGSAVLISSHQLSAIEELCDEVGILRNGRLVRLETGQGGRSAQQWIIATDVNCPAAGIITDGGGMEPAGEGGRWTFTVSQPGEQIPEIVRRLAGAGYPVREVRPASQGLREAIRMMFE